MLRKLRAWWPRRRTPIDDPFTDPFADALALRHRRAEFQRRAQLLAAAGTEQP